MEEKKNKTTPANIMANQSRKRTLPTLLIKDKLTADIQPPPRALTTDISIIKNELAPTPPNSPTMIKDLTYATDYEFEAKMKGLQADMGNSIDQSKIEELKRTVESLKAIHATLEHEALCYHFTIRRFIAENAWMKAYNEATDKLLTKKDAELRAVIRKRKKLEDSLGYWFGLPWTQKNPYI